MPPPTVRVNTLLKENANPHIDPISKIFIISEVMLGLDRMPLIGKGKFIYVFLTFILSIIWNVILIFFTVADEYHPTQIMMVAQITQTIITSLLSFTRCNRMQSYYSELNKFDTEVSCRPKVSFGCIRNAVQASLTCICIVILFVILDAVGALNYTPKQFIPMHIIYVLEVHYFGHLLNLLTPRLKLINYYIESSLYSANSEPRPLLKEFVYFKSYNAKVAEFPMRKLMDLYEIVVEAYDYLYEGIKWQLLAIIVSAFIAVLGFLYTFSLHAIRTGKILTENAILQLGVTFIIMIPLFAPCSFGDSVHNEVRKLRELLASRLYENKLDKSGRSAARALVAFTETRDLSFRLLRMLNVDISLPFKFMGFLVTYLIILLQFEKVINPKS